MNRPREKKHIKKSDAVLHKTRQSNRIIKTNWCHYNLYSVCKGFDTIGCCRFSAHTNMRQDGLRHV